MTRLCSAGEQSAEPERSVSSKGVRRDRAETQGSTEMLRTNGGRIFLEVAFTHGLIGAVHDTSWGPRHYKTIRVGLNVRR